jgi:hypothetical protein
MKIYSTTSGGWPTRRIAEIWTGHLTETDRVLFADGMPDSVKAATPGFMSSYPEGWYALIPGKTYIQDHLLQLQKWGLSREYMAIIMDLCKSGISIARFDSDAEPNIEFELFYKQNRPDS